jgi:hypothetical protein
MTGYLFFSSRFISVTEVRFLRNLLGEKLKKINNKFVIEIYLIYIKKVESTV